MLSLACTNKQPVMLFMVGSSQTKRGLNDISWSLWFPAELSRAPWIPVLNISQSKHLLSEVIFSHWPLGHGLQKLITGRAWEAITLNITVSPDRDRQGKGKASLKFALVCLAPWGDKGPSVFSVCELIFFFFFFTLSQYQVHFKSNWYQHQQFFSNLKTFSWYF